MSQNVDNRSPPADAPCAPDLSEITDDIGCPNCGYSLRGLRSGRCPECGHDIKTVRATRSQIPWSYRAEIGLLRALRRTVRLVVFRPRLFGVEVIRPVSFADAQRFRWTCVAIAFASVLFSFAAELIGNPDFRETINFAGWWLTAVTLVCSFGALAAMTGVQSYLFHPRLMSIERQNRAVALSYYACAPLYWSPGAFILLTLSLLCERFPAAGPGRLLGWLAAFYAAALAFLWWLAVMRIAGQCLPPARSAVTVTLLLPILWLISVALTLLGIPWLTLYVVTIFYSLRI